MRDRDGRPFAEPLCWQIVVKKGHATQPGLVSYLSSRLRLGGAVAAAGVLLAAGVAGAQADPTTSELASAPPAGSGSASEVEALRTQFSRTFEQADGTLLTRVAEEPLNFRKRDGTLEPIDSELQTLPDGSLETEATGYDLALPPDLNDPVSITQNGGGVSFELRGAAGPAIASGPVATYPDVLPGVDAEYTAAASFVKEDLVLADASARRHFAFDVEPTAGLTPRTTAGGAIVFENGVGNSEAYFAAPVMSDASGMTSQDLKYTLEPTGAGRWMVGLDADTSWLRSSERAWPIRVDPTVYFGVNNNLNTTFESKNPLNAPGSQPGNELGPVWLNAGYVPDGSTTWRTAIKMTLSGIPASAQVTNAKLNLHEAGDARPVQSGSPTVAVHGLTNPFTLAASWSRRDGTNAWASHGGDFSSPEVASKVVSAACNCFYSWDVTPLAAGWVSGARLNYGFMVKSNSGIGGGIAALDGLRTGQYAPWMEVTWRETTAPTLDVDGALWELRGSTLSRDIYDLAFDSVDEPADSASGVANVVVKVDGIERFRALPDAGCSGASCDVDNDTYELDARSLTGVHRLDVISTDVAGNVKTMTWTVTFGPEPAWNGSQTPPIGGDSNGAAFATASACSAETRVRLARRDQSAPTAIISGSWRSASGIAAPEITETWPDDSYRVTRCALDGSLAISQTMRPVPVPGGVEFLPTTITKPTGPDEFGVTILEYLDASDPTFRALWSGVRAEVLADRLPKTPVSLNNYWRIP